jgi:hypothetical protein
MRCAAGLVMLITAASALSACSREARVIDPDQPLTAPVGASDPRHGQFTDNLYQIAQGGRYFAWYGCGACHGAQARGTLDLADPRAKGGGSIDKLYAAIAAHGPLGKRIPTEQLWQLAAYVGQLPKLDPALRRRQDRDQAAEPQANQWSGPLR